MAEGSAGRLVHAAGGVLWRPAHPEAGASEGRWGGVPGAGGAAAAGAGIEVAVVHRPKYDDWSLPKGKVDPGEAAVAAACREVAEETGFTGVAGRSLGATRYAVWQRGRQVPKVVQWWAMRASGGGFTPNAEVDQLRWLPPSRVPELLTRPLDVEPLDRFLAGPPQTRTLVLIRHGSAGSRDQWRGDDAARPLDDAGRRSAAAAADVLPWYGVARLVSAPPVRCTSTLQPLAERLGRPLEVDPDLSDDAWAADPARAVQRLRRLVADGVPTVVCSQGEALPGSLRSLAEGTRLSLPDDVAKGSAWVLSFADDGTLLDLHGDVLDGQLVEADVLA